MPSEPRSDFDVMSLLQGPLNMMSGAMGVADNARKAVGGMVEAIASLQKAAVAVEQLVTRLNRLVDDIESPMRALAPEFEKAVSRMQRVSEAFEGPLDRLVPSLENAVGTFDRLTLSRLPDSMDQVREQLLAVVELFGELPRRLGAFSELMPGMDRLLSFAMPLRGANTTTDVARKPPTATPQSTKPQSTKPQSAAATTAVLKSGGPKPGPRRGRKPSTTGAANAASKSSTDKTTAGRRPSPRLSRET